MLGAYEDGMPVHDPALLAETPVSACPHAFSAGHEREAEAKKSPSRAEIMERYREAKAKRGMC